MRISEYRRALSSVISSVILSAAVLAVGGMVWNYSNGASSVIAAQYHDDSMDLINQLKERIMLEHVTNNSTHLTVQVYNYGEVDVLIDIYANTYTSDLENPITVYSKSSANTTITMTCSSGDSIGITVYTRRQNIVHYSYIAK